MTIQTWHLKILTLGPDYMRAVFAASHKICIRYLKDEDAHTQLTYLGGVSLCGSLIMALVVQQWTMPSTTLEWLLLLLTGEHQNQTES